MTGITVFHSNRTTCKYCYHTAIVVGGGPAPGINTVISSATIAAYNLGWECIGIMDGYVRYKHRNVVLTRSQCTVMLRFTHLIEGKTDRIVKLDIHNYGDKTIKVSRIHNRGYVVVMVNISFAVEPFSELHALIQQRIQLI